MGGLQRLKPTVIPENARRRYTCTTLGCPDDAVLILPLNTNAERALANPRYGSYGAYNAAEPGTRLDGGKAEVRLCRKCVRTLATALPAGMRLPGARLRYPELGGTNTAAAEEIAGTPEYDEAQRATRTRPLTNGGLE